MSAFHTIKNALANSSILIHPKTDVLTSLMADASEVAMGSVLHKFIDADWRPLAFFSNMLKATQRK